MRNLPIACVLFQPDGKVKKSTARYSPEWVDKLYRGIRRGIGREIEFICYSDRFYDFTEPVITRSLSKDIKGYFHCLEPLREPCIFMGLDTVITGDISWLDSFKHPLGLVSDPNRPKQAANMVVIANEPLEIENINSFNNEMQWLDRKKHLRLDGIYLNQLKSYKVHVQKEGLGAASIVYFHGQLKPDELMHLDWVQRYWR